MKQMTEKLTVPYFTIEKVFTTNTQQLFRPGSDTAIKTHFSCQHAFCTYVSLNIITYREPY